MHEGILSTQNPVSETSFPPYTLLPFLPCYSLVLLSPLWREDSTIVIETVLWYWMGSWCLENNDNNNNNSNKEEKRKG